MNRRKRESSRRDCARWISETLLNVEYSRRPLRYATASTASSLHSVKGHPHVATAARMPLTSRGDFSCRPPHSALRPTATPSLSPFQVPSPPTSSPHRILYTTPCPSSRLTIHHITLSARCAYVGMALSTPNQLLRLLPFSPPATSPSMALHLLVRQVPFPFAPYTVHPSIHPSRHMRHLTYPRNVPCSPLLSYSIPSVRGPHTRGWIDNAACNRRVGLRNALSCPRDVRSPVIAVRLPAPRGPDSAQEGPPWKRLKDGIREAESVGASSPRKQTFAEP